MKFVGNQMLVQAISRQKIGMRSVWIALLMTSANRWRGFCNGRAFKFGGGLFFDTR